MLEKYCTEPSNYVQVIQPTLEDIQVSVSKAGLMMIEVNRRVSQWDQQRIMSSVANAGARTLVASSRASKTSQATSAAPEEEERTRASTVHGGRPSTMPGPRASTVPAASEITKALGLATTDGGTTLGLPDQGQSHRLQS